MHRPVPPGLLEYSNLMRGVCVALMAITTSAIGAQERPDTATLAPVVVTASRAGGQQRVATSASTILSGDALRARGITTLADALREVPGAALVRAGAPGSEASLFLRGGERDYVQVMIDGVTVNEPGGSFNFAHLTLDNVERIEVVRGPASVLYGADAMTGVIQIFTRPPAANRRGELRMEGGQRGALDFEGMLTTGNRAGAFSASAGHHRSDGIYSFNNEWRTSVATGSLRLGSIDRGSMALRTRYSDARYNYPTDFDGAPIDINSYTTERRLFSGLEAARPLSGAVEAHLSAGVSRHQSISNDPPDTPGEFSFPPFELLSRRHNIDARVDVHTAMPATVTVGTDVDWQESEGTSEDAGSETFRRWNRAAYVQIVGNPSARRTYSLGARVDDNERFGTFRSLRGAVGMRLGRTTSIRAAAATAFKEPTFSEIHGGPFAAANLGLRPEQSESWEVGIEQQLGGPRFLVSATYFDQAFTDLLEFAEIEEPPFAQYQNANSARADGWELETRISSPGGPTLRAHLTILDAAIRGNATTPGSRLLRRPNRSASVTLSAPAANGLTFGGDVTYVGRRDDNLFSSGGAERVRMPSHTLVAVSAAWAPARSRYSVPLPGPSFQLFVRIDNLFDEDYEAVAGFASPGRTMRAGARVGFGW